MAITGTFIANPMATTSTRRIRVIVYTTAIIASERPVESAKCRSQQLIVRIVSASHEFDSLPAGRAGMAAPGCPEKQKRRRLECEPQRRDGKQRNAMVAQITSRRCRHESAAPFQQPVEAASDIPERTTVRRQMDMGRCRRSPAPCS